MGFEAVVTTGIYCRPGCAGRPRPDHVRPFATAAAAEAAGFRACLRCRPYRSSPPLPSSGPELVCRAVQLIVDGLLDTATEATLGARLGVSPRHLRRLFATHLGVTPDELARSRRAHFARRLLDDTDLRITDIAFAAGFGSVRQLNRACAEIFRATPGELRARRRRTDRLVADGGLLVRLPYQGPLDWAAMTAYFAARAIPGVEHVADGVYRRTVVIDGDPGVLELMPGDGEQLLLRVHLPHWEGLIHIVNRARRIVNLDTDLGESVAVLRREPTMRALIDAQPALRVPGTWDPFETGVRAILGQQVSVSAATRLSGRLVERIGTPVPGLAQLGLTHAFPTAATLADADLTDFGIPGSRAAALREFARAVAKDEVRLDRSVGLEELVASISALPGLGPWTAHYIALRIGESDAFPETDLGLRRTLARYTDEPLSDLAERWRPHRALAAVHLWMSTS